MPQSFKYPTSTLLLSDYIIGTDFSQENVTRNFKASDVVAAMLHSLSIGTVTSISTASSKYITATSVPSSIISTGNINLGLNATGLGTTLAEKRTQFLRGDNTWSLPGAAASEVQVQFNGNPLTTNVDSFNFTGNQEATASGFNLRVNMPGNQESVDSVIAGTAISTNSDTGQVQITNSGVVLLKQGGFVTLSGGTGAVTVNTTKNAGTVTVVNPGIGIDAITNNTSNPKISLEYALTNNYIDVSEVIVEISEVDIILYNQISSSNVKTTRIGSIEQSDLVLIKKDIDDNDSGAIKNTLNANNNVSKTQNMVSCTIGEYNQEVSNGTIDQNTLYFIVGAGQSYTATPSVTNQVGSGTSTTTSPSSVTGIVGTQYIFYTDITNVNGTYVASGSSPSRVTTVGNIVQNQGNVPITVTGSVTPPAQPTYQSRLNITFQGDLSNANTEGVDWRLKTTNSQDLDISPNPATVSGSFSFNSEIELINTSTHQFVTGNGYGAAPVYQTAVNSTLVPTPTYSVFSGAQTGAGSQPFPQIQKIEAYYSFKQYRTILTIVDNTTLTGTGASRANASISNWSITATGGNNTTNNIAYPGAAASIFGGYVNGDAYSWSNPSTPNISGSNYSWTTLPAYTWSSSGGTTPTGGTIAGADASDTLTITGTITYAPPTFGLVTFKLNSSAVTYAYGASSANWSVSPTVNATSGQVSTSAAYSTGGQSTAVISQDANYTWTNQVLTANSNPPYLARTLAEGGMPYTNYPTSNDSNYTLTGQLSGPAPIKAKVSSLKLTAAPVQGINVTYTVTYSWYNQNVGATNSVTRPLTAAYYSPYVYEVGPFDLDGLPTAGSNAGLVDFVVNRTGPSVGGYPANRSYRAYSIVFKKGGTSVGGSGGTSGSTVSNIQKQFSGITGTTSAYWMSVEINE